MAGSIVVVLLAAAFVCAAVALRRVYRDGRRSAVQGASVLQAVRDLGGRTTALQVTTQIGWRDSESPYVEVRAHLEAMVAEGVLRIEWAPISKWDTTPRKVYVLNSL